MKVDRVAYAYRGQAEEKLTDVSFTLQPGAITSLIGPNGAGKTTLLNLLSRQIQPTRGHITLAGRPLMAYSARDFARRVAVVHQHNPVYDDIAVADLVRFGQGAAAALFGGGQDAAWVQEIMGLLQLKPLAHRSLLTLSGGQQQRAWLALALAQKPQILLLDEPTTYLDLHFQNQFLQLLQTLKDRYHLTILIILHDLNQALSFSQRTLLLAGGRLVADDVPAAVITPATLARYFAIHAEWVTTSQGRQIVQLPE